MNSIHQKRYEMNQLKKKRIEKLFQDCQDTIIAQTLSAFGLTQGMFQDRDGGSVTTLHNFKQEDNKFVHEEIMQVIATQILIMIVLTTKLTQLNGVKKKKIVKNQG